VVPIEEQIDGKPMDNRQSRWVPYTPRPFLYANTYVEEGSGIALVCAVGSQTQFGIYNERVLGKNGASHLQKSI
jgi:magnesium-transporting ATPase (P-type)